MQNAQLFLKIKLSGLLYFTYTQAKKLLSATGEFESISW